ncbi:hypothetical protein BH18ACT4_BH18ACT4_11700 [soil metagenome]
MSHDLTNLTPGDAVSALRSYPRRFRSVLTGFDDDDRPDDLLHRPGTDGLSALDHAQSAARSLALLGEALRSVLIHDKPKLDAGVLDATAGTSGAGKATSADSVLDELTKHAGAVADLAVGADADDWRRVGVESGGREITAMELLREAVRRGSDGHRATEKAVRAARH